MSLADPTFVFSPMTEVWFPDGLSLYIEAGKFPYLWVNIVIVGGDTLVGMGLNPNLESYE